MGAPTQATEVRTTDVVIDQVMSRLGNDGISLGDDFCTRLNQIFGIPLEVTANSPTSTALKVGPSTYTLPDGQRVAILSDGNYPSLASGSIDFASGSISTGANPTFALPSVGVGKYIQALIQYKIDENKVNVTFGTQASTIDAAGLPALLDDYDPVTLVELHSTGGGTGIFDAIAATSLVKIWRYGVRKGISREKQDVSTTSQSVFNLSAVTIPKNRGRLLVLEGGQLLDPADDYTVNSDTQVTLTTPALNGARLTFIVI